MKYNKTTSDNITKSGRKNLVLLNNLLDEYERKKRRKAIDNILNRINKP